MNKSDSLIDPTSLEAFVEGFGVRAWQERLAELGAAASCPTRIGRATLQRHAIELTIERWRKAGRAHRTPRSR